MKFIKVRNWFEVWVNCKKDVKYSIETYPYITHLSKARTLQYLHSFTLDSLAIKKIYIKGPLFVCLYLVVFSITNHKFVSYFDPGSCSPSTDA